MSERRGWCPSLFHPMPSGDGLLVRVKPPWMRLCAEAALALADAAERHGNGAIELTSRGNLQIRGISPQTAAAFAAEMVALALASADSESERRRNLLVSPLAGDDPTIAPDTIAIAAEIERGLMAEPCFAALSTKFAIVVDGGGVLPLDGVRADIRVRAEKDVCRVSTAGGDAGASCKSSAAASTAIQLARANATRNASLRAKRSNPVFRPDSGLLRRFDLRNDVAMYDDRLAPNSIGFLRYPGLRRGALGLGIPFGATEAAKLACAARLALRFGDGLLRTTPWRALLIGGVAQSDAAPLLAAARDAGFIVDPADKRRRIVACVGAPGCASAAVAARADATFLAATLGETVGTIHVSGCRKSCAQHGAAAITLIGEDGRYAIVRHGTVADEPEAVGLSITDVASRLQREALA